MLLYYNYSFFFFTVVINNLGGKIVGNYENIQFFIRSKSTCLASILHLLYF